MNAILATEKESDRNMLFIRFLLITLPGAFLIGIAGSMLGTPDLYRENRWMVSFLVFLVLFGAGLLLSGMRSLDKPLLLLVFLPMPLLISFGFHLGYLGIDAGFPIGLLGMVWPMITCPRISRYYKRRATKAQLLETPAPHFPPAINASA
jgi:hypothetical protein